MKKTIIILLFLLVAFLAVGSLFMILSKERAPKEAQLIVYDATTDINDILVYDDGRSTMPLIEVLKTLNISVEWQNSDAASITYGDSKMTLSLTEKTLYADTGNFNWLDCVPGNTHYCCEVIDGDVMVDDTTMSCILYQLGALVNITQDYERGVVIIKER